MYFTVNSPNRSALTEYQRMPMTYYKSIIDNLHRQKSNYSSPELARDQANSLESLSTDIYTDRERFIYELLQNADDASSNSGRLEVLIKVEGDYLTISHLGEPFSEVDVESICSVGDGNKQEDENKTGFKGIGFKSVFSHSDQVIVNSGGYCFSFEKDAPSFQWPTQRWGDKQIWLAEREQKGKDGEIKMPWQIIPHWVTLTSTFDYLKPYSVSTLIRFRDISEIETELEELFSNTQILLFLRTPEVKITVSGNDTFTIEKRVEEGITSLRKDGVVMSEWLLRTFRFPVASETQQQLENDVRIPKKLRTAQRAEISFAAQLVEGKIKVADKENRLVFTYLPTSVNYDFPFLVNASFLTDAGRQHLHQDLYWNVWLFEQMPQQLIRWLAELAESDHQREILRLVPKRFSGSTKLQRAFNSGFTEALVSTAFVPNQKGQLLKAREVVFDTTEISTFLDPQLLIDFLNADLARGYTTKSLISALESLNTLKRLGGVFFTPKDLRRFLESEVFQQQHNLEENVNLINFLHQRSKQLEGEEKEAWDYELRNTPFLFDEEDELRSPAQIYFPGTGLATEFAEDIHLVHSQVMDGLFNTVKEWLRSLGVQEPSDKAFVEKTILWNREFVDENNAIAVGRYLFEIYKKGGLQSDHLENLKQFRLLTQKGNLIKAQDAFLADFYQPELALEAFYNNDFYVSAEYFTDDDFVSEWKTFFLKIGVSSTIGWETLQIPRSTLEKNYKGYFDQLPSGSPHGSYKNDFERYECKVLGFIDFAVDHAFAKKFWEAVFNNKVDPNLSYSDYGVHWFGSYGYRSITLPVKLNHWILHNRPVFPTVQGRSEVATNVFVNENWIREIGGKYLPVFDYEGNLPNSWLDYLPLKRAPDLDDLLSILTVIWLDTTQDEQELRENSSRIGLIYDKLAENYLGYEDKLRNWASVNKLLAKDGKTFLRPAELSVVTVDGFKAPTLAFCDEKNEQVINLLRIFGVQIFDEVIPEISNSCVEIQALKKQLNYILPLIAVVSVEKSKNKREWEKEYRRLQARLATASFFKTTAILLSYGNDQDKLSRSSWANENAFYYVGEWYKPRVLDGLVEPIGKFMGIRYAERHLSVLLSDVFSEGLEYIREKFGEEAVAMIPENLLYPAEPSSTDGVGDRNSPSNPIHEDIGHEGELFVYEELRRFYTNKYQIAVTETQQGFKVESLVEVIWRNKLERTTWNHDFKVLEGETEIYIDSKATSCPEHAEKVAFYLSSNEFRLMETAKMYLIARVFNVYSSPVVKFIRMDLTQLA